MTGTDVFHTTHMDRQPGEGEHSRVAVTHVSGWRIEHTGGARCGCGASNRVGMGTTRGRTLTGERSTT